MEIPLPKPDLEGQLFGTHSLAEWLAALFVGPDGQPAKIDASFLRNMRSHRRIPQGRDANGSYYTAAEARQIADVILKMPLGPKWSGPLRLRESSPQEAA